MLRRLRPSQLLVLLNTTFQEIPLAGPKDAAFRHYSGPVGKPTYEMKLRQGRGWEWEWSTYVEIALEKMKLCEVWIRFGGSEFIWIDWLFALQWQLQLQ